MSAALQFREHRPLFQQAPDYPLDMLATRREGFVDVGFTVDKDGFVQNPVVLKQTGGQSFEQAALDAVEQFRYAPKFVNGSAVETRFVKTRVTFNIE